MLPGWGKTGAVNRSPVAASILCRCSRERLAAAPTAPFGRVMMTMRLPPFESEARRSTMSSGPLRRLTIPATAFAILAGVSCAAPRPPAAPSVPQPMVEPRELTADAQVHHALNRLAFGARPGDVAAVRTTGVDKWIARQLAPEQIPDRVADSVLRKYETLHLRPRDLMRAYPAPAIVAAMNRRRGDTIVSAEERVAATRAREGYARISAELQSARVARAVVTERQLQEVMVDFWLNHFSVFIGKGPMRYYIGEFEREAIRPNALGHFGELLTDVARSPAMLFYLDNVQSFADSGRPALAGGRQTRMRGGRRRPMTPPASPPQASRRRGLNENYARELLELHTLGVDGGYTQADIIDVARAFTGWSIDDPRRGGEFTFRRAAHDAGPKVVLGTQLPAGRGIEDGEQVLDLLARHPSTARFIATKLAIRFVSDSPPPSVIERAAATFTRTNGDIRETVRTIVTSPEFFSRAAYRSKVKSPFETVVSSLRALGAAADTTARTAQLVARLGQPLYGRQSPDGWPEKGDAWMNTGAILNRINFGMALAAGRIPGARLQRWAAYDSLRAAPAEQQVDAVVSLLLGGDVSTDTRAVLLSGEHPFIAAAAASDSLVDAMPGRRSSLTGLAQTVGLALGSPEFQRR